MAANPAIQRLVPWLAAAAAVAIIVVLVVMRIDRPRAGQAAAPPTSPGSAVSSPPSSPLNQPPACPRTRSGSAGTADYADFVYHHGRTYVAGTRQSRGVSVRASDLARVVGRVTCTVSGLTADHHHRIVGPYREGNAAFLPVGTALHRVHGYKGKCRLAARWRGDIHVYLAERRGHHHGIAKCALHPRR